VSIAPHAEVSSTDADGRAIHMRPTQMRPTQMRPTQMRPTQMRPRPAVSLVLCALFAAFACIASLGCEEWQGSDPDAGANDGESDAPEVEIWAAVGGASDDGKGFIDWQSGEETAKMIRGPQGGQHVWVSVRMTGLSNKKLRMTVEMVREDNGKVVKPGAVPVMSSLKGNKFKPGGYQFSAITAFVKCPCQVAKKTLIVNLKLEDLYGRTYKTSAKVLALWDGDCSLPPSSSCAEQ